MNYSNRSSDNELSLLFESEILFYEPDLSCYIKKKFFKLIAFIFD